MSDKTILSQIPGKVLKDEQGGAEMRSLIGRLESFGGGDGKGELRCLGHRASCNRRVNRVNWVGVELEWQALGIGLS